MSKDDVEYVPYRGKHPLNRLITSAREQGISPEDFKFILRCLNIEQEFYDAVYQAGIITEEQYRHVVNDAGYTTRTPTDTEKQGTA